MNRASLAPSSSCLDAELRYQLILSYAKQVQKKCSGSTLMLYLSMSLMISPGYKKNDRNAWTRRRQISLPHSTRKACGSICILHLRIKSSCHFPLHRDRGDWGGEESCGSRRFQSTDCPGTKITMSEDHLSHATFATSGFIETVKIFQT